MFEIMFILLFIYLLVARYIEIKTLIDIKQKLDIKEEKAEKTKRVHARVAKAAYESPLKTFKEYDKYKSKKTGLYEPVKPSRGLKIEGDDEE